MRLNISAWSIRKPVPAIVLFMVLTLLGLDQLHASCRSPAFPTSTCRSSQVTRRRSRAPRRPSSRAQVTKKVEDAVASINGVKHIISTVTDGSSVDGHRVPPRGQPGPRAQRRQGRHRQDPHRPAAHHRRADRAAHRRRGPADPHLRGVRARHDAGAAVLVRRRRGQRAAAGREGRRPGRALSAASTARSASRSIPTGCWRSASPPATSTAAARDQRRSRRRPRRGRRPEQAIRTLAGARTVEDLAATTIALPGGRKVRLDELGTRDRRRQRAAHRSRASTASRSSPSASPAPRARATSSVADVVDKQDRRARRRASRTSDLDQDRRRGRLHARQLHIRHGDADRGRGARRARRALFLRDWRATLIAAIALPLSVIPTFWAMDAARLLAQPRQPARHHARHRHPGRRRHRRDREHRAPHAHGQVALSRRARGRRRDRPRRHRHHAHDRRDLRAGVASWAASPASISSSSA